MYSTTYHRASSVDEATALFGQGKEAKYLAGGHTLIPVMKQRLASPSDVIDLGTIKELVGIEPSADAVTIKAATPHYDVAVSEAVQKGIPALAHLASVIGDPAVRYRGTIGGSLANNDPAADYPAAVLALGATIKTNKRSIAADDYLQGAVCDRARRRRTDHRRLVPAPGKGGIREVPASRLALRADRGVRRQDQIWRCPRRRHRSIAERCHAGSCNRGCAEGQLVGGRPRQRQDLRRRIDERHPRIVRLPRQSRQGDGTTCGTAEWLALSGRSLSF